MGNEQEIKSCQIFNGESGGVQSCVETPPFVTQQSCKKVLKLTSSRARGLKEELLARLQESSRR